MTMNNLEIRKNALINRNILNILSVHVFIYSIACLAIFPESRHISVYVGIIIINVFMMILRKIDKASSK